MRRAAWAKGQLNGALTIDPTQPRPVIRNPPPTGMPAFWARLVQSPWWPVNLEAEVGVTDAQTRWGSVGRLRGRMTSSLRAGSPTLADETWAYWAWLEPFQLSWRGEMWDVRSPQLAVDRLDSKANGPRPDWRCRGWKPTSIWGISRRTPVWMWPRGRRSRAERRVSMCHQAAMLLNTNGQRWLRPVWLGDPPLARAQVSVVLPAWTNRHPNWRLEVLPTMRLDGYVEGGACSFRGAGADAARLHFSCENGSWHIPDLRLERPRVSWTGLRADVPTQDFYWRVRSRIDPRALRPLLEPASQRALGLFEFTAPPALAGEVWGRWHAVDRLGFAVQLAMTNFMVRGETADRLEAGLFYTNSFLGATNIHVRRGEGTIDARG